MPKLQPGLAGRSSAELTPKPRHESEAEDDTGEVTMDVTVPEVSDAPARPSPPPSPTPPLPPGICLTDCLRFHLQGCTAGDAITVSTEEHEFEVEVP